MRVLVCPFVLSFLVMAGCAPNIVPVPVVLRPEIVVAQLPAEGEDLEQVSVSAYALGECNQAKSWLPPEGIITQERWWTAYRAERDLRKSCIKRHHALVEETKALLGIIREPAE